MKRQRRNVNVRTASLIFFFFENGLGPLWLYLRKFATNWRGPSYRITKPWLTRHTVGVIITGSRFIRRFCEGRKLISVSRPRATNETRWMASWRVEEAACVRLESDAHCSNKRRMARGCHARPGYITMDFRSYKTQRLRPLLKFTGTAKLGNRCSRCFDESCETQAETTSAPLT